MNFRLITTERIVGIRIASYAKPQISVVGTKSKPRLGGGSRRPVESAVERNRMSSFRPGRRTTVGIVMRRLPKERTLILPRNQEKLLMTGRMQGIVLHGSEDRAGRRKWLR